VILISALADNGGASPDGKECDIDGDTAGRPRDLTGLTRRRFLAVGTGALAAGTLGLPRAPRSTRAVAGGPFGADVAEALRVLGRTTLRAPGNRPFPALPAGTDTLPGLDHIVVLMLENHSYDNFLGMLGRGRGQTDRGDGFTLGRNGLPTASNPAGGGRVQHAFRMPTTCQLPSRPSNEWTATHHQFDGGRMDGFVTTTISPASTLVTGPVAMGYWTQADLPFTYDLAGTFPVCDRYFASLMGATDPNRRYLIAATSSGMTGDVGTGAGNAVPDATLALPANGTIFTRLTAAGISWTDYCESYPLGATANLYPLPNGPLGVANKKPFDDFFTDAANDKLPGFSLLDPNFGTQSQENPQNIVVGEALLARVVRAIGSSPAWPRTLFVLTYDEHGGYYDHVPPPVALAPDAIPPVVQPGESGYDGFRRYGMRVPTVLVSPYAKREYVSGLVYDHTSILALIERKWNLASLTYRDANANDLTDCLDLVALAHATPTFPHLPALAAAGDTPRALACSTTGPGAIPPPGSLSGMATGTGTQGAGSGSSAPANTSRIGGLADTGGLPAATAALAITGVAGALALTVRQGRRPAGVDADTPAAPLESPG